LFLRTLKSSDKIPIFLQSLETYLRGSGGRLPEVVVNNIITSILYTLAALHAKGICHRDLKLSNILLRDASNPCDVVLIDFGSSFMPGKKPPVVGGAQSSSGAMKTICGTPYFLSPELIRGLEYTSKVDLWSVGCLVYALLFGRSPFEDSKSFQDLFSRISRADFTPFPTEANGPSESARWFVRYLLDTEPSFRPEAGQALSHPWIAPHVAMPQRVSGRKPSGMLVDFDENAGLLSFVDPARV